ncbi:exodeoxyribonuclease I [Methylovulum sp.]|uniref:exodeoxyribonuclease I n=1 Tax=Methylovulum sp. TaxID=1916980 RepID=UPI00261F79AA|nr:exodeoxyribonuclease I [Methylovulum sp.]MDD5124592.1 exodeoxyribonuclease I [Methylovulum sp.]
MRERSHDQQTLYWHDYETTGIDPQKDRPVQFAGIRTDIDFNIIEAPLVVYGKLPVDVLPNPDSCVITGITPQLLDQKGVCEADFIRLINAKFSQQNTCTLGYNSLRFDDEFTRNSLYRNFYDPYAREWQNGNSRWDLIDVVRAARALRPDGIQWPLNDEGKPSFRLDQLTKANGISHEAAHDALSDVYATIALAKLVKKKQPKLYQFLWQHRVKSEVLNLLALGSFKPVVHVSGKYPVAKNCLAIVLPVCKHPSNNNGVVVYDLSIDPEPMLSLSAEDIQHRLFTATDNLPEGMARIPLKTVHINKCPVLAPLSVIRTDDAQRLEIDLTLCQVHIEKIKKAVGLTEKLSAVFDNGAYLGLGVDPDLAIYSGGFFSGADKQVMAKIKASSPEQLAKGNFNFTDSRLPEMLFRYRARNYPQTLNAGDKQKWQIFCVDRLTNSQAGGGITIGQYFSRLDELRDGNAINEEMLAALTDFGNEKMRQLGIKN